MLLFGDIKAGVKPPAVKDRQRQAAGDAHLLGRVAKEIAQVQGVLLQKRHQVKIRVKRGFCGLYAAERRLNVPVRRLQIGTAGQQIVTELRGHFTFHLRQGDRM